MVSATVDMIGSLVGEAASAFGDDRLFLEKRVEGGRHIEAFTNREQLVAALATAAGDRTIRFWQPSIGRMMRYVRLESEPLDIAWTGESQIIASCVDGKARVVDTANVKVLQTIPVIKGWAYAVVTHPNDGSIAIAGSDGQLHRVGLQKLN